MNNLSDDALVAELRERGLVGPISPDFLTEFREHRTFVDLMARVEATPGAPEKLRRAMVQIGIIPADDAGDERLIAAWQSFRTGVSDYEATGPDAPPAVDAPALVRWETADDVVAAAPATTVAGALVKLRRALLSLAGDRWVETAVVAGDDPTLFGRASDLSYPAQLVVDAIAALQLVQRGEAA